MTAPNIGEQYPVVLGETLRKTAGKDTYSDSPTDVFTVLRYDFKPASLEGKKAELEKVGSNISLKYSPNVGDNLDNNKIELFKGEISPAKQSEYLIRFDGTKFIIDSIDIVTKVKYMRESKRKRPSSSSV
uniref:Transcription elongation factor Eaf N-terminal domain-containing protein n=1 Tax=Aplanochytrium stocchinoi TaxID=215587 RepID=A0A7S3V1M5_9STRA|mmetsp:Transcript_16233/g.20103  ORF Transcript_16233/g.20103 Transcript_16233/m.20103 type:complete len:130 (-) Transcript_16233:355-744(-)|eukprot:CAMPEP_0204830904 /NCGR_PEP_ID=MMETSP1346-20131115/9478_1 /ASSEMBLY_ACC=CAM_ASM_000771 /TAXON_ID=215587 /ORGANISM="Aplanochytrium stocchinoi, Strain GSBS06" /LENGTH=129 /DNA_ID=CAMNT_0051961517 /DNA_START=134 /DNA_END=523 /DNA_ORIENTATION=+